MKLISIVIPTYEMHGHGATFLRFSFDKLILQSFKDFDVVISDNSNDDAIKKLCDEYKDKLDINYFANDINDRKKASKNFNNGLKHATGKIIKILCMDDFLYDETSLKKMIDAFDISKDSWLVTACLSTDNGTDFFRPFTPRYHDKIHYGKNTISSPSVVMIKNDKQILFDDNLIWHLDTDYYRRCHDAYGDPVIVKEFTVVNRQSPFQMTNTTANENIRQNEYKYILNKYKVPGAQMLFLKYKMQRYYRALKQGIKKIL
jgi:glycosyltransferase involved in cell wall biosynthesis